MWEEVSYKPEKGPGACCGWCKRVQWREGEPEPVKDGSSQITPHLPPKVVRHLQH